MVESGRFAEAGVANVDVAALHSFPTSSPPFPGTPFDVCRRRESSLLLDHNHQWQQSLIVFWTSHLFCYSQQAGGVYTHFGVTTVRATPTRSHRVLAVGTTIWGRQIRAPRSKRESNELVPLLPPCCAQGTWRYNYPRECSSLDSLPSFSSKPKDHAKSGCARVVSYPNGSATPDRY